MNMKRRDVLKKLGTSSFATAAMAGCPLNMTAHAADTSDYKALVCVFLFGGIDGHDFIIPADSASYSQYSTIRQSLINQYGGARAQENLLGLGSLGPDVSGGREFGLPPEMPRLQSLYQSGDAALVANVGPLVEPVTRLDIDLGTAQLPSRLFSHNDQQSTWVSGGVEGSSFGWGGLFADAILAGNGQEAFSTITIGDGNLFLTGQNNMPFTITNGGAAVIDTSNFPPFQDAAINEFLRFQNFSENNVIARDVASILRDSIDNNATFSDAFTGAVDVSNQFSGGFLNSQLAAIARTINARDTLQANRQIFFVFQGGHDTHSAQAAANPGLFSELDSAIGEFQAVMQAMGTDSEVTLFTASDFGRTLTINGDGTDHGWGNHHFVVGGAVNGGRVYGDIPPPAVNSDFDFTSGRLIPQWSVEQMAGSLGEWFGLTPEEIENALPNIGRFDGSIPGLFVG